MLRKPRAIEVEQAGGSYLKHAGDTECDAGRDPQREELGALEAEGHQTAQQYPAGAAGHGCCVDEAEEVARRCHPRPCTLHSRA